MKKQNIFKILCIIMIISVIFIYKINNTQSKTNDNFNIKVICINSSCKVPKFSKKILNYSFEVPNNVSKIKFEIIGKDNTKINDLNVKNIYNLKIGKNIFSITNKKSNYKYEITRKSKKKSNKQEIKKYDNEIVNKENIDDNMIKVVNLNKINDDNKSLVELEDINIIKGSEISIDLDNKEYKITDKNIIDVIDNKIVGKNEGKSEIIINENNFVIKKIEINVLKNIIDTNEFLIEQKNEKILNVKKDNLTVLMFKTLLNNDSNNIKVYENDIELSDYEIVKNGVKVKLIQNEIVYDNVILILKGDINMDGVVDILDKVELQKYLLSIKSLNNYQLYAADVTEDGQVDVTDNIKLGNYIVGIIEEL